MSKKEVDLVVFGGAIQELKRKGKFVCLLGGLPKGVSVGFFCFGLSLFNGFLLRNKKESKKGEEYLSAWKTLSSLSLVSKVGKMSFIFGDG